MKVSVVSAGFFTSVQDLGRVGFRQSGISVGGALDPHAMRVANALIGNEDNAAGLEATMGNLRLRFEDQRIVAWCGGAFTVRIGRADLPPGHAGLVAQGEELMLSAPKTGSRAWLAISGGIDVPSVLGSRSTDFRGNFGGHQGRTLRDGDTLPLGESSVSPGRVAEMFGDRKIAEWTALSSWITTAQRARFLRVLPAPDWSLFTPEAQAALISQPFTVMLDSDRMGARLDGPDLERADASDLLSEAVAPGTLQVPPNGKPILLLGDCQTVGGYPKIAQVITVDLSIAAQLWPGDQVRFHEISLGEAQFLVREREEDFARFRVGLSLHKS
ncbi:MAG: antagonist of KipI [Verrucomicrobiota bacterium]|jgi:antagonist of KipI